MKPFALAILVLGLAACDNKPAPTPPTPAKTPAKTAAKEKQDPVCGMKGEKLSIKSTFEKKDYFFCSADCKKEFEANSVKYKWGFCDCAKTMGNCRCPHCAKNSEPCDCADEKPGEHDHDHDHK